MSGLDIIKNYGNHRRKRNIIKQEIQDTNNVEREELIEELATTKNRKTAVKDIPPNRELFKIIQKCLNVGF